MSIGMSKDKSPAERQKWADENLNEDGVMTKLPANSPATFRFGEYTFLYEDLVDASDDHKNTVTAQISIWKDGENLGAVYPAKWDYRKGSEATTEVAIKVRASEDVYVVLTGYDLDGKLANFRVFINPLISWVWIGFLILAFGTFICLIPQSLVDMVAGRGGGPKTRLGNAANLSLIALLAFGLLAATATQANAQAEHVKPGMGMGDTSTGWASMNRPSNDTEGDAMKELLCPCGCKRESIFICKCQSAATLRGMVVDLINERNPDGTAKFDLTKKEGREKAYQYALDQYVAQYGTQSLATPKSSVSWLFPSLGVIGGLGLLFVVGRRFINRGRDVVATADAVKPTAGDDVYADKLDDELAGTDD
jgi:cytochrome c-type biogenesis protein CcmF